MKTILWWYLLVTQSLCIEISKRYFYNNIPFLTITVRNNSTGLNKGLTQLLQLSSTKWWVVHLKWIWTMLVLRLKSIGICHLTQTSKTSTLIDGSWMMRDTTPTFSPTKLASPLHLASIFLQMRIRRASKITMGWLWIMSAAQQVHC